MGVARRHEQREIQPREDERCVEQEGDHEAKVTISPLAVHRLPVGFRPAHVGAFFCQIARAASTGIPNCEPTVE
jgi:hypothetical protein